MASLIITDAKIAHKLKSEKDQIITTFRKKYIVNQQDNDGAFSAVTNMFSGNFARKVSVQSFPDGSKYEGFLNTDGTRQGKGIMYLNNGDVFCGDWLNGHFEGFGHYIFANGER